MAARVWIDEGLIADAGTVSVGDFVHWDLFFARDGDLAWLAGVIGSAEARRVTHDHHGNGEALSSLVQGIVTGIDEIWKPAANPGPQESPFQRQGLHPVSAAALVSEPLNRRIGFLIDIASG